MASSNEAAATAPPAVDPEVENAGFDDNDSAYDSEIASYTTSLASNVTDYKEIAGRRFHSYKEGSYIFPNDEAEQDRLDLLHKVLEVALGKSWRAPINDPKRVLDLGTGTGIWALDFADQHPQADVLGNDLSPVQPRWVPTNVRFEVDDIEAPWTYSQTFDYIHCRCLYAAIKDWPKLVGQIFENLRPGGYAEMVDFQVTMQSPDNTASPEATSLGKFNKYIIDLSKEMGQDPDPGPQLEGWMKSAGFTEVTVKRSPLPIGTWARDKHLKEVGAWMHLQVLEGLESFVAYLFSVKLGWSKEEVDVFCAKVRTDLKSPKVHSMLEIYSVVGKKPESSTA